MSDRNVNRIATLNSLVGLPWVSNARGPDAYDCYYLVKHVQQEIFGRSLPEVDVPNNPGLKWIMEQIAQHPERRKWREAEMLQGFVTAGDGAIVAMGAIERPAHLGVWFKAERAILHTDKPEGVVFQDLLSCRARGWQRMRFYEYIG